MIGHPFLTWTDDADAEPQSAIDERRQRGRRAYGQRLVSFILALIGGLNGTV